MKLFPRVYLLGTWKGSQSPLLGMEESCFTDPLDDLSRLVATSTSRTHLQDNASMCFGDVGSQLKCFAQKRRASEIDFAETPIDYGSTSLKHAKVNSWNISFAHPDSYTELTPSACVRNRKWSSVHKQQEQVPVDEDFLICVENELHQNVKSTQTVLCQSDIEGFGRRRKQKQCPDSSSSGILKEELFSLNYKLFGKDAETLSKGEAHVMAERRRREELNQKFIALSAMVPGLKKVDKATILADAVKYVKRLEEQLKVLEDRAPKAVNSAAVRKYDEGSYNYPRKILGSKDEKFKGLQQPNIEARVVGKNVLIHVHCDKIESVLVKAVEELENLHLSVVNANVLSFSNTALDLTFTAQIEEDSELAADDIVKALHIFFTKLK